MPGLRMQERHAPAARAGDRRPVDEAKPAAGEILERALEVGHREADVMEAGPAPGEEPSHRRIGRGRLEQLETGVPHGKERCHDPLSGQLLAMRDLEAERAVHVEPFGDRADGDSDMVHAESAHPRTIRA